MKELLVSEFNDLLQCGHYETPSGFDNVDWFVDEVIKIENKMNKFFKYTKNENILTKEAEEMLKEVNTC